MKLLSAAFEHFDPIPVRYTGEGEDISPPLNWQNVPTGTQSFALICEDPDAPNGTWDHWILYNIPPTMTSFDEGLKELPQEIQSCHNSWGKPGYGGPNPPSGTHRYFFILYALDSMLELPDGATKADLINAIKGHILTEATIIGTYQLKHGR